MALVCKATDELRITIFFASFDVMEINELVVTNVKLTNSSTILAINNLV
jgi:hypothetical protein